MGISMVPGFASSQNVKVSSYNEGLFLVRDGERVLAKVLLRTGLRSCWYPDTFLRRWVESPLLS